MDTEQKQEQETLSAEQVRELLKQADQLMAEGNFEEEVDKFRIIAEKGGQYSKFGQFNLGVRYYHGQGVEQSYEEALKWYRMAADQGLAEAEYVIGDMYFCGTGGVQDNETALEWFTKANDHGHPKAGGACMVVREAIIRDTIAENRRNSQDEDETSNPQHNFGQPFFRTQEEGIKPSAIIGGYYLMGEVLRDVQIGSASMLKRKKGTICRVNMIDAAGNACTAEIVGYARQDGDRTVHKHEIQQYVAGDKVIFIVRRAGAWIIPQEPVEPVEVFDPDGGNVAPTSDVAEPAQKREAKETGKKREGFFRWLFNFFFYKK